MKVQQFNKFLKEHILLFSKSPLFVFITGASGAGKTHLTKALEKELDPEVCQVEFFDRIGVPPLEEMIKEFGSGEKWQEAMTHKWVQKLALIKNKKVILLEGQFNPHFALDACKKFNIRRYILILLHAEKNIRERRLVKYRNQPELANETMENWAQVLKRETKKLGGTVINTSNASLQSIVEKILDLIKEKL